MWKILHVVFGFDYVYWDNSVDNGIARVYIYDGNVCYWRYRITHVLDKITKPSQVMWLTCSSSKYFPESES